MEYNRKQTSLEPIDILKFDTVKTGAVFKQYDINTSILELELVANGEPVHLKDEKVYVTVKSSNSLSTQLLSKYSGASVKEKDNYKVLLRAKKSRRRDVNNIIDVYISPLALENSGEMIAEVMIIDLIKEERITSQSFTFEIKPSITPNRPSESAYKLVKDLDGTYITDAEDVQLLVAEVEPNFKLSFVGTRVNEILEKANNFDVEDNTNKIQALQEKDVELESKISNLEKKDSSLDGEIASLKSSDQSIEEEIQGLKSKDESIESKISQLKSKDTAIDGEIDKLKNADETIKSDINSKYEELKQKTDATNNEVMKLKAQDTTLGESIRTNKGLIDVINPKVATLEQENQNVKNRVSVLEGDMNLAKSNISSLQSSNTELSQKVEGVEQDNASINEILEQLQRDVESYKSSIELLESKVPVWKDFKGESFKVENSFYGKSRGMIIKGKTLQNLVIDGNRTNVIDNSINSNSRIHNFKAPYNLQRGKKYVGYLKIDNIENSKYGLRLYGLGIEASGAYYTIGDKAGIYKFTWNTSTAPESITEFHTLGIYLDNEDFVNGGKATFSDFMLFEEGTDLTYIDEYFDGIKSFGQQEDKISILSHGKNLLNINDFYITLKNISNNGIFEEEKDGRKCIKITQLSQFWDKGYEKIKFKEKTRYTFTGTAFHTSNNRSILTIKYNDGSYVDISIDANEWNKFNFISDGNKTIKGIFSAYTTDTFAYIDKNTFMIEEGEPPTEFEQYKSDKKDILLQDLGFDEGLRGLSPTVYDELNDIKNVAIKRIEKIIINGNTDDGNNYLYYSDGRFVIKVPSLSINKKDRAYVLCDKLPYNYSAYTTIGQYGISGYGDISAEFVGRWDFGKTVTDRATFIEYLKTNPIIVYYELAEPVETPLNKDINFDTLDDITYVSLENNIKNELSCQCQVSLASSKA